MVNKNVGVVGRRVSYALGVFAFVGETARCAARQITTANAVAFDQTGAVSVPYARARAVSDVVHKTIRKTCVARHTRTCAEIALIVVGSVKRDLFVPRLVADARGAAARNRVVAHNPNVDRVSAAESRVLSLVVRARKNSCSYDADAHEGRAVVANRRALSRAPLILAALYNAATTTVATVASRHPKTTRGTKVRRRQHSCPRRTLQTFAPMYLFPTTTNTKTNRTVTATKPLCGNSTVKHKSPTDNVCVTPSDFCNSLDVSYFTTVERL